MFQTIVKQLRILFSVAIVSTVIVAAAHAIWHFREPIKWLTGIQLERKVVFITPATLIKLKSLEQAFLEHLAESADSIQASYYKPSNVVIPDSTPTAIRAYVKEAPYAGKLEGIDITKFSVELCAAVGVDFPYIHGVLIPFKETSFCKSTDGGKSYPTFCSEDWEYIMPGITDRAGAWNPHNASGMKYPSHRPTTALMTNGQMFRQFQDKYGLKINPKYKFMLDDPHACYEDYVQHALDLRLWQQRWYSIFEAKAKKKGIKWTRPQTPVEYIMFLKESGYNPYAKYYRRKDRGGLLDLYEMSLTGEFQKKYGHIYNQRMGLKLDSIPTKLIKAK